METASGGKNSSFQLRKWLVTLVEVIKTFNIIHWTSFRETKVHSKLCIYSFIHLYFLNYAFK